MAKCSDNRVYLAVGGVERVEYPCQKCREGFYRFDPQGERKTTHNQMPHRCTSCKDVVYFTLPYPALRYKNRLFVDWQTVRGLSGEVDVQ